MAFLNENGYEGFQETDGLLIASIPESEKDEDLLLQILNRISGDKNTISFTSVVLPDVNWNAKWENDFQPIEIDDFVRIRASFHPPDPAYKFDLLIDPKMSFGTGHHETTRLMIRAMKSILFRGKRVVDLGCGTAILSILASRMGADEIIAVDIDHWAVENSWENVKANQCTNINVLHGDADLLMNDRFDIILANINRNVLLEYMYSMAIMLPAGGDLILSGILFQDRDAILHSATKHGFIERDVTREKEWCAMTFYKEPDR